MHARPLRPVVVSCELCGSCQGCAAYLVQEACVFDGALLGCDAGEASGLAALALLSSAAGGEGGGHFSPALPNMSTCSGCLGCSVKSVVVQPRAMRFWAMA